MKLQKWLAHTSQTEIASLLFIDRSLLSHWKSGVSRPSIEMIGRIQAVSGATFEDIVLHFLSIPRKEKK